MIDECSQIVSSKVFVPIEKDSSVVVEEKTVEKIEIKTKSKEPMKQPESYSKLMKLEKETQEEYESEVLSMIEEFKERASNINSAVKEDIMIVDEIEDKLEKDLSSVKSVKGMLNFTISKTKAGLMSYLFFIVSWIVALLAMKFLPKF